MVGFDMWLPIPTLVGRNDLFIWLQIDRWHRVLSTANATHFLFYFQRSTQLKSWFALFAAAAAAAAAALLL
jgi:hypothetical protein